MVAPLSDVGWQIVILIGVATIISGATEVAPPDRTKSARYIFDENALSLRCGLSEQIGDVHRQPGERWVAMWGVYQTAVDPPLAPAFGRGYWTQGRDDLTGRP